MRKRLIRGWISLIPLALVTYVVLHVYQETQGAWPSVVSGNGNLSRNNLNFTNHSSAVTPTRASLSSQSSSLPSPPADSKSQNVSKTTPVTKHTLPIEYLKGKVLVRDRYEAGFSTPHEDLCPSNGSGLKLFVFVTSAPDHERQRRAIRLTWGSFVLRKDLSLAFVIGRTSNSEIQSNIDKENELYGDVIEANFIDHYSNLTLKTMSIFEWLHLHCTDVKFVLKTDDDMFINIPLLLALVDTRKSDKKTIYGRYARNWGPVRNKKSKYYIDHKTYSRTKYPNFLTGPAYLFTSDVADLLFQRTMAAPFFTLEDVLVTGFVAESLGLRRIGVSHFKNDRIKLTDVCKLKRAISIHMVKYDEQFDIHKKILDGKTKCKTR